MKIKPGHWYALSTASGEFMSAHCATIEDAQRIASSGHRYIRVSAPKPIVTRKIKRSELRAWFERQVNPYVAYSRPHSEGPYGVACDWSSREGPVFYGPTLESAILKLRQAMRKAGTFKP